MNNRLRDEKIYLHIIDILLSVGLEAVRFSAAEASPNAAYMMCSIPEAHPGHCDLGAKARSGNTGCSIWYASSSN